MAQQRRMVRFSGNVQGVGFRYTTFHLAGGYEVTGYVRNLPDGCVEVLVEGEPEQVDAFLGAVQDRMGYYIHKLTQQQSAATGEFGSFNISF